jgi:HD superfamily phosphohydrolase
MKQISFRDIEKAVKELEKGWNLQSAERPSRNKRGYLRDPIYGYHALSDIDFEFLDSPPLQRLRYITHLGFVDKIYPGANHTRFEHSIGVAAVAERIMNTLREKHKSMTPRLKINQSEIWTAKIAGYLHDIGHLPFSHASEGIFFALEIPKIVNNALGLGDTYAPHELFSYLMAKTPYIQEMVSTVSRQKHLSLDAQQISSAILGIPKGEKRYLSDIIHSSTDADRIDYLLRDGYYTGVPHGQVDLDHLARSFCAIRREKSIWLGIEERGLEAVEALYSSRDIMYPTVYLHHTSRIAEAMLTHTLFFAHRDKKINLLDLLGMNDAQLLAKLGEIGYREIADKFMYRRLHKRVMVIRARDIEYKGKTVDKLLHEGNKRIKKSVGKINEYFSSWKHLIDFEAEILGKTNLEEGQVLIDVSKDFIGLPRTEEDLVPEDYLPVRMRQGDSEPIWRLSPIICGIETLSKSLRSCVIVAADSSLKTKPIERVRKVFRQKFEEKFNLDVASSAFFERKA